MKTFTITCTVTCEDLDQATTVAGERLGCDEDYGFDYQLGSPTVAEVADHLTAAP